MASDAITLFGEWARKGRADPMARSHAPRATAALEQLPLRDTHRVLDLGCGEGWATRWLAERLPEGEAVGLDGSDDMLAQARAKATSPRATFVRGELDALPFDDGSFDHAFSMEALYYVDLDRALAEVARVVRRGGSLAACTDFYEEHADSHAWPEQLGLVMDLRSEAQWVHALSQAGFRDVRTARLRGPADRAGHAGTLAVFGVRC
jgi:ubiquinone/menaquinone biosynthesis C-methylase UbiE